MVETHDYSCKDCNKKYKDKSGLWYHNKKYHTNISTPSVTNCIQPVQNCLHSGLQSSIHDIEITNIICKYCKTQLSNRQSRWRHEKNCKKKDKKIIEKSEIQELKNEIEKKFEEIMNKISNSQKLITKNNNTNNGTINNGKMIIINKTGTENIKELTYDEVSKIFDNEISSVIKLIEFINFSEDRPHNHSFCSTALESPYLSYYNTTTNTIDKERKKYFFEEIICKHINNHEILYNNFKNKFNSKKRRQIEDNIYNLKQMRDNSFNNKIMQEIIRKLNLISYNKRELIQDTWNGKKYDNDNNSDEEFMQMLLEDPENNNELKENNDDDIKQKKKKNIIIKTDSSSSDSEDEKPKLIKKKENTIIKTDSSSSDSEDEKEKLIKKKKNIIIKTESSSSDSEDEKEK